MSKQRFTTTKNKCFAGNPVLTLHGFHRRTHKSDFVERVQLADMRYPSQERPCQKKGKSPDTRHPCVVDIKERAREKKKVGGRGFVEMLGFPYLKKKWVRKLVGEGNVDLHSFSCSPQHTKWLGREIGPWKFLGVPFRVHAS